LGKVTIKITGNIEDRLLDEDEKQLINSGIQEFLEYDIGLSDVEVQIEEDQGSFIVDLESGNIYSVQKNGQIKRLGAC